MALTTAQLNAHIRTMIVDQLQRENGNSRAALMFLLRACARHARSGTADDLEAAKTAAQFIFETVLGRSMTADDAHYLRKHLNLDSGAADGIF